ncbi:MAG: hypothetical protein MJZ38_00680 [archaeon]|nr:hypothetical protein [archaeon]
MSNRVMYLLAFGVYLLFFAALVADFMCFRNDEQTMVFGMYLLSTGLMAVTLILAALFLRRSPSERYQEMYAEKEKEDEGKKDW